MKNSSNTIRNRTRGLPACSALPQPTAPPYALSASSNELNNAWSYVSTFQCFHAVVLNNKKTGLPEFTFSELCWGWEEGGSSNITAENRCIFVPFMIIWIKPIVGECNKVSYMSVVLTCLPLLQLIERNTYVLTDMWYLRSWASCHWS